MARRREPLVDWALWRQCEQRLARLERGIVRHLKSLTRMKTKLTFLILNCAFLILLCGCNTMVFTATKPDGTQVSVKSARVFWATEEYAAQISTNSASLSARKSNVDAAAIEATAAGVARGLKP